MARSSTAIRGGFNGSGYLQDRQAERQGGRSQASSAVSAVSSAHHPQGSSWWRALLMSEPLRGPLLSYQGGQVAGPGPLPSPLVSGLPSYRRAPPCTRFWSARPGYIFPAITPPGSARSRGAGVSPASSPAVWSAGARAIPSPSFRDSLMLIRRGGHEAVPPRDVSSRRARSVLGVLWITPSLSISSAIPLFCTLLTLRKASRRVSSS